MRKIKYIIISIISIILLLFVIGKSNETTAAGDSGAPASYTLQIMEDWNPGSKTTDSWGTKYQVHTNLLAAGKNGYCVQQGNSLYDKGGSYGSTWHKVRTVVRIEGTVAQWYNFNPDTSKVSKINGRWCDIPENAILAAMLCATETPSGVKLGLGMGNPGAYRESQVALYDYWDEWRGKVNTALSAKGYSSGLSGGGNNSKFETPYLSDYKKLAEQNSYCVTIIYMEHDYAVPTLQKVIFVEREDPKPIKQTINIPVKKQWVDGEFTKLRPSEITVKLLSNGVDTGKTIKLNSSNNWSNTFKDLDEKDASGKTIQYTVKEVGVPEDYNVNISGNMTNGFTIKNILKTKVKVIKKWDDNDNLAGMRPDSITIKLYRGENELKTALLNESNNWQATFENLAKYDTSGKLYNYTVKEEGIISEYEDTYSVPEVDEYGNTTITITNKYNPHYDGYIEITGKVWEDLKDGKANTINGTLDDDENGLGGIKVILKDASGNSIKSTYSDENGNFTRIDYAITKNDGTYTIKVNYDNSYNVYKLYEDIATVEEKLKTAYVEFEYDGLTYTTVATASTGTNTSKAIEDETRRGSLDNTYSTIDSSTSTKDALTSESKNITAITKNVITSFEEYQAIAENKETRDDEDKPSIFCDGTNCQQTNTQGAWNEIKTTGHTHANCPTSKTLTIPVTTIKNVNLGLMTREQPDLEVNEELSQVEVEMNGQKYIYTYRGVQEIEKNEDKIQVSFQNGNINNGVYVYRRPVNPSNVAEVVNNKGTMSVFVTYEVKVTNSSDSLISKVNSITNYFDKEYTLVSATIAGNNIANNISNETDFNKATLSGLNIQLNSRETSSAIELRYEVSQNAIKDLLNEEATLSNAVEIESYSTCYGEKTLYAEQRTGGRTGNPYGAYDKDSHPGNAGIHSEQVDFTYTYYGTTTTYADEKVLVATVKEDDTDIAPSFLLCKDETPKTLSGTVFEDTDVITDDAERLGDGKYDSSTEKIIQNVKVELYEVGSTEVAKLYDYTYEYNEDGSVKRAEIKKDDAGNTVLIDAIQYTSESGNYAFNGVITGKEYYAKFTYGDDTSELIGATKIKDVEPAVNARNYKSTIIADATLKGIMQSNATDFDKYWYIKIDDNNSVAVDNMLDRLQIEDLQYSNFHKNGDGTTYIKPENMSAYSKSFIIPVEFDTEAGSNVESNSGSIGKSNNLSKLDFGIIERPREDLFAEKTITNIKITLANGQKLIEGDPRTDSLNYVKAMGFQDAITNSSQARKVGNKRLLAELDAELTQGAQLDIAYEVKVTNHNEIDYDYGVSGDYADITGNKYITTSNKANYYYYGDKTGLTELKATLQVVDYMSSNIAYKENSNWTKVEDLTTLYQDGKDNETNLISKDTYNAIKQECNVLQPTDGLITIARGETSNTLTMRASKVLTSQADNVYDNHVEIIKIDGKTARTIQFADGVLKEKTYYPGNYVPGLSIDEQDDDGAQVIITPPTGIIDIIIYVVAGLLGLIVIAGGIMFIKKKVLTK